MTRARNSANLASHGNLFVDIANDRTGIGSVVPAQNLHVAGTAGFHADTTFTGDLYNTVWDRSANTLQVKANAILKIGQGSYSCDIRTDGVNLNIDHNAISGFFLRTTDLQVIGSGNRSGTTYDNTILRARTGIVELGHEIGNGGANGFKLATAAYGVNVTGTTDTDGLVVSGVATVTTMNVTGVLTYDDVTSVDSVGIVTARQGVSITGGDLTINTASPTLNFTETNGDPDYRMFVNGGIFTLVDTTNNIDRFSVTSSRITLNETVLVNDSILYIHDKIVHWGDDNTSMRFPATDTISFNTNNAERLRIDSNGNIGVNATPATSGTLYNTVDHFLVIGDNDTGIAQDGDGQFEIWANNTEIANFNTGGVTLTTGLTVGGVTRIGNSSGSLGINCIPASSGGFGSNTSKFAIGDNDTGLAQISDGVLAFYTNNAEVFRINGTKKFMIGTTAASTLASSDDLTISTSGSTGITLFSATGNAGNLTFGDGTSGDDRQRGLLQYHHSDDSMRFFTDAAERVRIDSNGDLGINVSNPTEKLHVSGNIKVTGQFYQSVPADNWSQSNTFIELNGMGNLTHQGSYETCLTSNGYRNSSTQWTSYAINSYTGASQIRLNPQGHIIFGTESNKANGSTHVVTERLRIDSSGRVQIASTNNSASGTRLVVGSGNNMAATVLINTQDTDINALTLSNWDGATTSNKVIIAFDNSGRGSFSMGMPAATNAFAFFADIDGATNERLRIDSSGRVLISGQDVFSSTSLTHRLQVKSQSDAHAIAIIGRNGDDIGELTFFEADKSTRLGEIQYRQDHVNFRHRVGYIAFATGGATEKVRITDTGYVGINVTNPQAFLDIGGNTDGHVKASFTRANDPNFRIQFRNESSSNNVGDSQGKFGLFYASTSADICGMQFHRGSSTGAGSLTFTTGGTEKLRITSTGDFGIGTDSPDRKLDVSGTGNVYGKFQSTNATGAGIEVKDTSEDWLIQADGGSVDGLAFYDLGRTAYRFVMGNAGQLGIGGANYGSSGQVLTSGGASGAASWTTVTGTTINNNANDRVITGSGTANTLNGESQLSFNGSTMSIGSGSSDEKLKLFGTNPYIRFLEGSTEKAYIQWNANGWLQLQNQESGEDVRIKSGTNGLIFRHDGTESKVFHAGNDGSGSGLDADLLDGVQGGAHIRSGAQNSVSGWHISDYRNGSGNSPRMYFSHSSGYGMHINTYNTSGSIYCLELHNNSKQLFKVFNNGEALHGGTLYPGANNSYDLGTSSARWRNLYTQDLQLSNEAKKDEGGNDVDGTWGDWTLQEGESDVYMINNRSGKKFRIKMEEV